MRYKKITVYRPIILNYETDRINKKNTLSDPES